MKHLKLITIVAVPLLFAAGCETMNQNDKACSTRPTRMRPKQRQHR